MCLGELKCPSLSYVYDMTWAEFCIRLYAYKRQEKKEMYNLRFLAYNNLTAPYRDPKKIPKSIELFLPLDSEDNTNEMKDIIKQRSLQAREEYKRKLKELQNG